MRVASSSIALTDQKGFQLPRMTGRNQFMARKRYVIDYADSVEDDLASMRAYERSFILDRIDE